MSPELRLNKNSPCGYIYTANIVTEQKQGLLVYVARAKTEQEQPLWVYIYSQHCNWTKTGPVGLCRQS